jgi:hypothetical protein
MYVSFLSFFIHFCSCQIQNFIEISLIAVHVEVPSRHCWRSSSTKCRNIRRTTRTTIEVLRNSFHPLSYQENLSAYVLVSSPSQVVFSNISAIAKLTRVNQRAPLSASDHRTRTFKVRNMNALNVAELLIRNRT